MARKRKPIEEVQEVINDTTQSLVEQAVSWFRTPTGSRRKAWEDLSPQYRRRLEKAGIGREEHSRGQSLYRARGHGKAEQARADRAYQRRLDAFVERYSDTYGDSLGNIRDSGNVEHSRADLRRALEGLPREEVEDIIRRQEEAEERWSRGDKDVAQRLYATRPRQALEWMFYYHGAFH